MGIDNVKNEIVGQAQQEAERTLAQARTGVASILDKTRQEIEEYRTQSLQRTHQLLETMERKSLATARAEAQRREMNVRTQLVNEVRAAVRDHFLSLGKTEKQKFLSTLLSRARKEIEVGTVYVHKQDEAFVKGQSHTGGHTGKIVVKDIAGGLIAETADATISVNYSIEELIDTAMNLHAHEIREVLFDND